MEGIRGFQGSEVHGSMVGSELMILLILWFADPVAFEFGV
jgi:hypothetical protein